MMKCSRSLRWPCWVVPLLVQLIALFLVAQSDSILASNALTSQFSPEGHKIQVSDPVLAKKIETQGGTLIADYGGFRLYEIPQLSPSLLANTRAELRDRYDVIELHAGHLNTRKPEIRALSKTVSSFTGKRLHLVQFAGPVQAQWRAQLLAAGVQIVSYIPENAYLIYGDAPAIARIQKMAAKNPVFQWQATYLDQYKTHPRAKPFDTHGNPREIGTDLFDIQLVDDPQANQRTLNLLDRLKLEPFKRQVRLLHHLDLIVRLNPQDLSQLAAQPDVISILPYFPRQKACERQDQIVAGNLANGVPFGPGYLGWLANHGFTQAQFAASGIVVDVSDSGVDDGTTLPNHFGLYTGGNATNASRMVYARYESAVSYATNSLEGCDGHGTINAHIIGGYDDFSGFPFTDNAGFHYGLGVCPFVNIGSSVIFDSAKRDAFYYPNFQKLQSDAYNGGARISNNSWGGSGSEGLYDSEAQLFDSLVRDADVVGSTNTTNQQMVIVFAAGNDGAGSQTMDAPATAKNVIAVGAADNVQPFSAPDRSNIGDDQATNADEIASFSSRGPCADGRAKPDLVAPGTHISGGVVQATNDFVDYPDGLADSCFNGSNISGGPDGIFWPTNQQLYTASSGTSQSAPCVSGGCALVMQYFINHFSNAPSPAMTKAFLMNSARYLAGTTANDTLPSPGQGMGEMNLGTAFDGTPRILRDQCSDDVFTNSGQIRGFTGRVVNTNAPFRVTLAWTDAPGTTSGSAWNNNLDLQVTIGGNTYKGNVFNGAFSTNGGTADYKNNVESVFLPAGVRGDFVVTVTATGINAPAIPNTNDLPNQDFALVIYNGISETRPVLTPAGTTLLSESCWQTNGVIDPGETVTVNFALQNIGSAATSNLVVTLFTNNGIVPQSASQNYGALPPGATVSQPFTFVANGSCGGSVTATLLLRDGDTNLGIVDFDFMLGKFVPAAVFTENFDEVTTPDLPTNWTSTATGAASRWLTTSDQYETPTNSAFAADTNMAGLTELISPSIPIVTSTAQLSFMNYYDLEASPSNSVSPTNAFDGGVLEISIAGGPFQDILQAGGSFVSGGYLATVSSSENPLHDRAVWCGNSGGFIQTVVNLPPSAMGQNIQLRWACGTDNGNVFGGTGWHIDSISIMDGYYTCCTPLVAPVIMNPQIIEGNLVFSFQSIGGQPYSVQSCDDLANPSWLTIQSLTGDGTIIAITNYAGAPQSFYRITSP